MKIEYLGHSCFVLESDGGTRIVTDPYGDVGYRMPAVRADGVTVSHSHYDHCNVSAVGGAPRIVREAGTGRIGDVSYTAVKSYHDDAKGRKRGENLIFRFEADGISVCHLGDIGEPDPADVFRRVGRADILLLPVGGNYTVDAPAAFAYLTAFSPFAAIPMHYRTPSLNIDIAGPEEFLSLCARNGKRMESIGSVYVPARETFSENTKIILMERRT